MAVTYNAELGLVECLMADVVLSTSAVNTVGDATTNPRLSVYEPAVIRITDHVRDDWTTGDSVEKAAIFMNKQHGKPWTNDVGLEHIISNADATLTNATVIFPDFDYTTFE